MADKPKFDPNKSFEATTSEKPAFDPAKAFEPEVKKKVPAEGSLPTSAPVSDSSSVLSSLPSESTSASAPLSPAGTVTDDQRSAIQDFLSTPHIAPAGTPSKESVSDIIARKSVVNTSNNILDNKVEVLPEDIQAANKAVVKNQDKINGEVKTELVGAFGKYNLKDEGSIQRYFNGYKDKGYNEVEIDNAKKDFFTSIGAQMPLEPETSYAEGAVKSFDEGLAGMWRTMDNATMLIDKALGTHGRGGAFENLAIGLEQHAEKMQDAPKGVAGDVIKGVAGSIPFLYQVALAPEVGIPKISAAMAANAFVNKLSESTKDKKDISLSDLVPAAGEAATEGIKGAVLHGLGYTSSVVGDMVKAATESNAAGGLTAAALNSLGFGGLDAAEQYAKTGNVDLSQVASSIGQGVVFSAGEFKKIITEQAKTRATENFFSTDPALISQVLKMDIDPVAMREHSMKLGEEAEKAQGADQKNEFLLAKKAIDKMIDIHALGKDVLKDPQKYIKDIKNNKEIPEDQKMALVDHVNKIANENDAKAQEGKPISDEINKKKEELSALKEDGTLDPNIRAAKMAPIENDIKELSQKLQTIYDPKLKAELEAKAKKEAEKKADTAPVKEGEPKPKADESQKTQETQDLLKSTTDSSAGTGEPVVTEAKTDIVKAPAPKQVSGRTVSELSEQELKDLGFENKHEALNSAKKRVEGSEGMTAKTMPVEYLDIAKRHKGEMERSDVIKNLPQKLTDFETSAFGSETKESSDFKPSKNILRKLPALIGKTQDKLFADRLSSFGEGLAKGVEKMGVSDNKALRATSDIVRGLFPASALSKEAVTSSDLFHGNLNRATSDAAKINENLKEIVGDNQVSLSKIDRVIDPDFYKKLTKEEFIEKIEQDNPDQTTPEQAKELYKEYSDRFKEEPKITYEDLTPSEQKVHDMVKLINELTHDVSFAIGGISPDTYAKNKGKYAGRDYDIHELPEDVQKQMGDLYNKTDEGIFKKRQEVDDWKRLHKIEDPVYTATNRLRRVMINKAVIDYATEIGKIKPEFVSDVEKPGFSKMGEKGYGPLSGKYVAQNVAEDFRGFFYQNDSLNKVYDILNSYNRWAPRQFYKKLFTVYNPGVHVGNILGDNMFGFLMGVDPLTLNSNIGFAKGEVKNYGDTYRYLIKRGLLKSDLTKQDMLQSLDRLNNAQNEAAKSSNPIKALAQKVGEGASNVAEKAQKIYGAVDDLYKMAAFKSLTDAGYTAEKAVEMVAEGFQNYKRVGKAYDFTSKIPIIGQPFGKFGGDLARILKNAAIKRPLNTIAFGATLHLISSLASQYSGESEEQRKIREGRPGAAKIPMPDALGGDISLDWLLKDKVLNVARFVSPIYVYGAADQSEDKYEAVKKMLPFSLETVDKTDNPNGVTAVMIAKNINDPLFTWMQALPKIDSDFRGKSILDPASKSYDKSNISSEERGFNAMRFIGRQYLPYGALGDDLIMASLGKEGYYNKKTVPQVLSRFLGVKLEDFPKEKYGKILENKVKLTQNELMETARKINSVRVLLSKKEITQDQANKRIAPLLENQAVLSKEITGLVNNKFAAHKKKRLGGG